MTWVFMRLAYLADIHSVCCIPVSFIIFQMTHTVFVYGTLQKGEPNYHLLDISDESSVKFIGILI